MTELPAERPYRFVPTPFRDYAGHDEIVPVHRGGAS